MTIRVEIINSSINTAEIVVRRIAAKKGDTGESNHIQPGQRCAVDLESQDRIEIGELTTDRAKSG